MKKKNIIKYFLLLFAVLPNVPYLKAQISQKLYNTLAEGKKPKEPQNINHKEIGLILKEYYSFLDLSLRDELSDLAKKYGQKYSSIQNVNERIKYLNDFSWFWYQRNLPDSVDKFTKLALFEAKRFSATDPGLAGYSHKMRAYYNIDKEDFAGAYADFQKAKNLFKSINDFEQLSDCLAGEMMIYNKLQLYDRVIEHADSTLLFIIKNTKQYYSNDLIPYVNLIKSRAYINKFGKYLKPSLADSAKLILPKILKVKVENQVRWHIEAYTELARLSYFQKQYKQSILYADSAFALENPSILENTDQAIRQVYKGLSLIEIGETEKGFSLISKVNRKKDAEYNGILLNQLYEKESQRKNYDKALQYHIELLEHYQNSQLINHRGLVFELERKNEILAKNLQIANLQKRESNVFRIALIIIIVLFAVGLYFLNRYRMAKQKTQKLINQLDELANIQLIRVQEAESKIKEKIARDLHDDFSASIAASTQFLHSLAIGEKNEENQYKLNSVTNILKDSYRKARAMSHQIYQDEGEAKFWEGLVDQVNLLFSTNNIELDVNFETEGLILPTKLKVAILMIVKEAIVNILKHSKATQVQLLFFRDSDMLNLEISDNGKGISPTQKSGFGLESIKNRVNEMKGKLQIYSPELGGTKLLVLFPFTA